MDAARDDGKKFQARSEGTIRQIDEDLLQFQRVCLSAVYPEAPQASLDALAGELEAASREIVGARTFCPVLDRIRPCVSNVLSIKDFPVSALGPLIRLLANKIDGESQAFVSAFSAVLPILIGSTVELTRLSSAENISLELERLASRAKSIIDMSSVYDAEKLAKVLRSFDGSGWDEKFEAYIKAVDSRVANNAIALLSKIIDQWGVATGYDCVHFFMSAPRDPLFWHCYSKIVEDLWDQVPRHRAVAFLVDVKNHIVGDPFRMALMCELWSLRRGIGELLPSLETLLRLQGSEARYAMEAADAQYWRKEHLRVLRGPGYEKRLTLACVGIFLGCMGGIGVTVGYLTNFLTGEWAIGLAVVCFVMLFSGPSLMDSLGTLSNQELEKRVRAVELVNKFKENP